ncbi:uncharacterized protein K460DRAFT_435119 [Cucurbitaria berberidis CBS 394.84]|uniref:Uncharacterized protein n=1 Tax=Cucurbitaria berberidis CBS 394.84 TaxID=1168544 RepID=A0A9P4GAU7_9PLEO|nr:uncharacterized protein K460DRAFT_435119 [Cucurbitaria berberidis CBS 394.84]KAF1841869.1 hypothetical protein K460DRAFT_435119 [Cucurbitaria berberidis CBS 394.84]
MTLHRRINSQHASLAYKLSKAQDRSSQRYTTLPDMNQSTIFLIVTIFPCLATLAFLFSLLTFHRTQRTLQTGRRLRRLEAEAILTTSTVDHLAALVENDRRRIQSLANGLHATRRLMERQEGQRNRVSESPNTSRTPRIHRQVSAEQAHTNGVVPGRMAGRLRPTVHATTRLQHPEVITSPGRTHSSGDEGEHYRASRSADASNTPLPSSLDQIRYHISIQIESGVEQFENASSGGSEEGEVNGARQEINGEDPSVSARINGEMVNGNPHSESQTTLVEGDADRNLNASPSPSSPSPSSISSSSVSLRRLNPTLSGDTLVNTYSSDSDHVPLLAIRRRVVMRSAAPRRGEALTPAQHVQLEDLEADLREAEGGWWGLRDGNTEEERTRAGASRLADAELRTGGRQDVNLVGREASDSAVIGDDEAYLDEEGETREGTC